MGTIGAARITSDGSGASPHDLDEARAGYRRLLAQDPANVKAMIGLADIERRRGDDKAACHYLRSAISIHPDSIKALTDLGAILRDLDQPGEATSLYRRILAIKDDHAPAHLGLAWIARASHNDEGARQHFTLAAECLRAAAERDPHNVRILSELATALRELGRIEEAAAIYRQVLAQKPDHAASHIGLGWIARKTANDEEALTHFRTATKLNPADLEPRTILGRILMLMHRFEEAESVYRGIVLQAPNNSQARWALGVIASSRQYWSDALEHFRAAVELDPKNVQIRIDLARALYNLSEWEDAERNYRSALQDSPGNLEAIIGMAETAKARGDTKAALALFEEAAAAGPLDLRPKLEIRRLKIARGTYDWRTEIEEAVATARCPSAPVETRIEAAKILAEYGLTEVARPVLSSIETRSPAARQLLLLVRQIERMGLAQPLAANDADPAEHQLESLSGFLEMPVPNADTLLIVFGGTNNRVSITFSLLHKILRKTGVSVVYCRDLQQEWYARGVVGLGTDFRSSVSGFEALARRYGARRILTLGNCVGCQGALRFGLSLGASGVLGLDPKIRLETLEPRQRTQLAAVREHLPVGRRSIRDQYADAVSRPKVALIFSDHPSVDSGGVRAMADVPDVAVTGLPDSTDTVKDLLVRGLLEPVLRGFVENGTVSPELRAEICASATPQYSH